MAEEKKAIRKSINATSTMNKYMADYFYELDNASKTKEKKIAWFDDIPQIGLSSIKLETSEDDLTEYITKDEYKLRSHTVTRQLISSNTDIEINVK